MMRGGTLAVCAGILALTTAYGLAAPSSSPAGATPTPRDVAFQHARARLGDLNVQALTTPYPDPGGLLTAPHVSCRFVRKAASGTSSKFDCELPGGEVVKVKYGIEPEIHAEVAATRLLAALGYGSDHMYLVPFLRCYGCPSNPFLTMEIVDLTGRKELYPNDDRKYTDFEWVSVERKFEAPEIDDHARKGWAFWELKRVHAPAAELDALRLVAVFLAHWDNKDENQRLVCMDTPVQSGQPCRDPLLMLQDVGATFGPMKVNLAQWDAMPVWSDRATCTVSMRGLPYAGSTFSDDARITEEARRRVGHDLESFSDTDVRAWFAAARFPEFYSGTDRARNLDAWTRTFHRRVKQIVNGGPCPQ